MTVYLPPSARPLCAPGRHDEGIHHDGRHALGRLYGAGDNQQESEGAVGRGVDDKIKGHGEGRSIEDVNYL